MQTLKKGCCLGLFRVHVDNIICFVSYNICSFSFGNLALSKFRLENNKFGVLKKLTNTLFGIRSHHHSHYKNI